MPVTEQGSQKGTNLLLDPGSQCLVRFECQKCVGDSKSAVSIIVPVYNEVDIISKNLSYLSSCLGANYELIVCDDCSTDGTCYVVSSIAKIRSNIRLLRFGNRVGKGGTIKKGTEVSNGDLIVFIDADLSASVKDLPKLLRLASERDVLVISRRTIGERLTQGPLRLLLSLGYNLIVRLVFGTGVTDHQCGFKAMSKTVARRLMAETANNGFVFDTELIVVAKKLGVPIQEVGIDWVERRSRSANGKWMRATLEMLRELVLLRFNFQRSKSS